jgi:hypothetical protein
MQRSAEKLKKGRNRQMDGSGFSIQGLLAIPDRAKRDCFQLVF